jgi:hypothetical protein
MALDEALFAPHPARGGMGGKGAARLAFDHRERRSMPRPAEPYGGFEQGPIRPPSEAESLLIRVTRNCPWNHCRFCPVYKGERFSLRPLEHVLADIDRVHRHVARIGELTARAPLEASALPILLRQGDGDPAALRAALHWHWAGMERIFLQDANSLVIRPADLIAILRHLRLRFPWVKRITSYARSHTVARIDDGDLAAMAAAGLNRIHIGMESGSDEVLRLMRKGSSQAQHIRAGLKVKRAGMELSEYIMPGLGGRDLSEIHARESAAALNRIDPDFIRLRTLSIPRGIPLWEEQRAGRFVKCSELQTVREIRLLVAGLEGIGGRIQSDHVLNLFQELEGRLPEDRERLLALLDRFLVLDPQERCRYQVGRRLGLLGGLADLEHPERRARAIEACRQLGITAENADEAIDALMQRMI